MPKPINTSLYDFPRIIEEGYVYVDKTDRLYELAKPGADVVYYLPRPRRFGKSLMISTLKALFQGRRDLFRGLAIERSDWDWKKEVYPVLHLDMSMASSTSVAGFEEKLSVLMESLCSALDVAYDSKKSASANFLKLLEELPRKSPNGKYVLLIDEYDAPIAALLKTAFAKIPHEWLDRDEKEVKRYFLAFMVFARAEVNSEEQHSLGRPDSVVKTEKAIYVVEFRYGKSADAALAQCREKRYADAYAADGRRVVYVGVNYNPAKRTVDEVRAERVGGHQSAVINA